MFLSTSMRYSNWSSLAIRVCCAVNVVCVFVFTLWLNSFPSFIIFRFCTFAPCRSFWLCIPLSLCPLFCARIFHSGARVCAHTHTHTFRLFYFFVVHLLCLVSFVANILMQTVRNSSLFSVYILLLFNLDITTKEILSIDWMITNANNKLNAIDDNSQ